MLTQRSASTISARKFWVCPTDRCTEVHVAGERHGICRAQAWRKLGGRNLQLYISWNQPTQPMKIGLNPPEKYGKLSYSHLGKLGKSSTQICQTSGGYDNSMEGNLPTTDFLGAILVAGRQMGFIHLLKGLPSVQYTKTIQKNPPKRVWNTTFHLRVAIICPGAFFKGLLKFTLPSTSWGTWRYTSNCFSHYCILRNKKMVLGMLDFMGFLLK